MKRIGLKNSHMKKLMKIFLLSCKKASELIDKRAVIKLNAKERVMLGMHIKVCSACAAYKKQSKIIDSLLHNHLDPSDESSVQQVANEDLKRKISARL